MLRGFSRSGVLDAVGVVDEDAVVVVRVWLLFFFLFFEWLERSSLGYGSFRGTRVVFSSGGRTVELLWTSKPEKNLQHKQTVWEAPRSLMMLNLMLGCIVQESTVSG